MTANWKATRDSSAAGVSVRRRKGGKPPLYAVTIVAVSVAPPGEPVQFLGQCDFDNMQHVLFTDIRDVAEGSFTQILPKPGWGHTPRSISLSHPMGSVGAVDYSDCSLNNAHFLASLGVFSDAMPDLPVEFFQTGVRLMRKEVPKVSRLIYREALLGVAELVEAQPDNVAVWKLLLIFDGLILAPTDPSEAAAAAIKRRIRFLRAGDWAQLLPELQFRTGHSPSTSPVNSDPTLARALRAHAALSRTGVVRI